MDTLPRLTFTNSDVLHYNPGETPEQRTVAAWCRQVARRLNVTDGQEQLPEEIKAYILSVGVAMLCDEEDPLGVAVWQLIGERLRQKFERLGYVR